MPEQDNGTSVFYSIFNGTREVGVPADLINRYEEVMYPIKWYTIECAAMSEGADATSPDSVLTDAVVSGLEYDIYFATHTPDEISSAVRQGIIH